MSGIAILVFLVHCTGGVFICETMPTDQMRFASMDNCQSELAELLSKKNGSKGAGVWMGKCVYRLTSSDPRRTRRDRIFDGSRVLKTARSMR